MRRWIGAVIALSLSGCGGLTSISAENGGHILHSSTESVYYSPKTASHPTMTLAQVRKALPELLINRQSRRGEYVVLNGNQIHQVRIGRTHLEISTRSETVVLPLKDLNVDLMYLSSGIIPDRFVINLTDNKQIGFDMAPDEFKKSIADSLYVLKRVAMSDQDDATFAETARAYREARTKPALPEAARRLRIQVEDAVQDKNFENAADLCLEATRVTPWWPDGHYNCAVVLSETGDYDLAVREMKRYLLLVPNAPDAQAAQNNIYKWERRAGTPN